MKKIIIVIFILLISIPLLIRFLELDNTKWDLTLIGNTENIEKPVFNIEEFIDKEYQYKYNLYIDSCLYPRGILTHIYSTTQYTLFNKSDKSTGNNELGPIVQILGKNKNIFQTTCIKKHYALEEQFDFSLNENQKKINNFTKLLEKTRENLKKCNKELYVYIAPGKDDFYENDIPDKYKNLNGNVITSDLALRHVIEKTDIPHRFFIDIKEELDYPAFYTTGIHWSRTYEQKASRIIIEDLRNITKKKYRNLKLGEICSSEIPFWRDSDVHDLLNVFNSRNQMYYQYNSVREYPEEYDHIKLFLYGDSFSEGLVKDILDLYPSETIHTAFYNKIYRFRGQDKFRFDDNWDLLDWQSIIDDIDVVVIGITDTNIPLYGEHMLENLCDFLDNYVPNDKANKDKNILKEINCLSKIPFDTKNTFGLYSRENGFCWSKPYARINLTNDNITKYGLEIKYKIPSYLFDDNKKEEIYVYINGKKFMHSYFDFEQEVDYIISADELKKCYTGNDNYDIEIYSSNYFVPNTSDNRELSLQFIYIGSAKKE